MQIAKPPLLGSLTPFTRILFSILLIIVCFSLIFFTGLLAAVPFTGLGLTDLMGNLSDYENPQTLNLLRYFQVLQSFALFIVPALVAGYLFHGSSVGYLGLRHPSNGVAFLLVFALMFAALPFINWMVTMNEMMKLPASLKEIEAWMKTTETEAARLTAAFIKMDSFGIFLFNFFMIALLPAVGEELLFRGLLQRLLRDWLGNVHVAIFLTALFFSAMHMQFYGFLPRMMLGVLFGYLFYWSGSLWLPIWAHLVNNGSVVIFAYLAQKGLFSGDYESFGATDNLLVVLISALTVAMVLFIIRKRYETT